MPGVSAGGRIILVVVVNSVGAADQQIVNRTDAGRILTRSRSAASRSTTNSLAGKINLSPSENEPYRVRVIVGS